MPSLIPVFLPRCWSGRKRTFGAFSSPHFITAAALEEVHTAPPLRPQRAFMPAMEFI